MFSEVRSRLQRADSGLSSSGGRPSIVRSSRPSFRSLPWIQQKGGGANDEQITESDVRELRRAAAALRKQLQHIEEDEVACNNEACGVATNGLLMLREDLVDKRRKRDELREALAEARIELERVENECDEAEEEREKCREEVNRMQEGTEKARSDLINLRAEMKQASYFQEVVDSETKYRLRADLENLKIEKERDEIALRNLNKEQNRLRTDLVMLKAQRDALQSETNERKKELSEAKMTQEMYAAHQEALSTHLQSLGGDLKSSMAGMVSNMLSFGGRKAKDKILVESRSLRGGSKEDGSPGRRGGGRASRPHTPNNINMVGGIVLGGSTAAGESEFLKKLPTVFKMGASSDNNENVGEYVSRKQREVEFQSDSHSVSAISAITVDEDAWTESESEDT